MQTKINMALELRNELNGKNEKIQNGKDLVIFAIYHGQG